MIDIVSRRQWGAQHEPGDGPAPLPAREVWLHHSVTVAPDLVPPYDDELAAMRLLERIGEQRFGRGISYTFAVMPSGRVYEGHGVGTLGAHTKGRNSTARAVVLVGNYDAQLVTPEQIESTARLLVDGHRVGWWIAAQLAGGHRQAPGAQTACPGRHGSAAVTLINERARALITAKDDELTPTEAQALFYIVGQLAGQDRPQKDGGGWHTPTDGHYRTLVDLARHAVNVGNDAQKQLTALRSEVAGLRAQLGQ